eukprot:353513-Chlamydomonas_euryale.AAC.2
MVYRQCELAQFGESGMPRHQTDTEWCTANLSWHNFNKQPFVNSRPRHPATPPASQLQTTSLTPQPPKPTVWSTCLPPPGFQASADPPSPPHSRHPAWLICFTPNSSLPPDALPFHPARPARCPPIPPRQVRQIRSLAPLFRQVGQIPSHPHPPDPPGALPIPSSRCLAGPSPTLKPSGPGHIPPPHPSSPSAPPPLRTLFSTPHLLRLALEHRRLVCQADLVQHGVRVEALGHGLSVARRAQSRTIGTIAHNRHNRAQSAQSRTIRTIAQIGTIAHRGAAQRQHERQNTRPDFAF